MPQVKVGDINLSYNVRGDGQPLIMIAGFATAQNAWFPLVRAFSKHYRVVTFDNRGIGGSDKPTGTYTTKMMAGDTIALMDHLGIDRAHVLGGSMGGMIAQHIAIDHPQRVDKLILFSTSAGGQPLRDMLFDLAEATTPNWNRSSSDLAGADLRKLTAAIASQSFNQPFNRLMVVPLARLMLRLGITKVPAGQLEAMMTHNVLDRLNLIQAPTLILTGSKDRLMPPQSPEVLASRITGAKLVTIDRGSHALAEGMSGRFNKEVLDFLGSGS
jgi:pimeloyl-ACP methyl ester carboxylesterase